MRFSSLSFKIAFRYLFSKKSTNAINIISGVSMLGMGVGALALVLVLSVFNGFENLVTTLYNSYYPDIEITAKQGKVFTDDSLLVHKIYATGAVQYLSKTVEENCYLKYGDKDYIATLKGVDETYDSVTDVKSQVKAGDFILRDSLVDYAVLGGNIYQALNINLERSMSPLTITVPRNGVKNALIPEDAFNSKDALPGGVFSIQQEFDSKYVFVSLPFAKELLGIENQVSAYELKMKPGADIVSAKEKLKTLLGNEYKVKDRFEQKEVLYRVMKMERWAVFAILSFILLLISFNIIGSLSMLVMDKGRDISILKAMGASSKTIQQIFLLEGFLMGTIGATVGTALGVSICLLQLKFGFIKLTDGGGSFVVDAYPVALQAADIVLTFAIVTGISLLAALLPAKRAGSVPLNFNS